jgi:hypothetical protein
MIASKGELLFTGKDTQCKNPNRMPRVDLFYHSADPKIDEMSTLSSAFNPSGLPMPNRPRASGSY